MTSITSESSGTGSRRRFAVDAESSASESASASSRRDRSGAGCVSRVVLLAFSGLDLSRLSRFGAGFSAMLDGESSSSAATRSTGLLSVFLALAGLLLLASSSAFAVFLLADFDFVLEGVVPFDFLAGSAAAALPRGFQTCASASSARHASHSTE